MKSICVRMTEEDVDQGLGGNMGSCALALAVRRAVRENEIPAGRGVTVTGDGCVWWSGNCLVSNSREIEQFTTAFDRWKEQRGLRPDPLPPFKLEVPL